MKVESRALLRQLVHILSCTKALSPRIFSPTVSPNSDGPLQLSERTKVFGNGFENIVLQFQLQRRGPGSLPEAYLKLFSLLHQQNSCTDVQRIILKSYVTAKIHSLTGRK